MPRYALGRDHHKLIHERLSLLTQKINAALPEDYPFKGKGSFKGQNRAFVDSAPAKPICLPHHGLADSDLVDLFKWTEEEFLTRTEGSAIRRIGYEGWLWNLAVSLGNAPNDEQIITVLKARRE